jgi:cytochrome c biogenesis protein
MERFWQSIDKIWSALASVKITFFTFIALLLLSIPGTIILQKNISSVDPGLEYSFDFWQWGQWFQLFTAYHSFWYVGLIILLALNLIACSVERWPSMWRLTLKKPVPLAPATLQKRAQKRIFQWDTRLNREEFLAKAETFSNSSWFPSTVIKEEKEEVQVFWQKHRWTRMGNVVVHTSLLIIFFGAIVSSLYGFEGALNVPEASSVDTFLAFKEGNLSGLRSVKGGLPNERLMSFRLEAVDFQVEFYEDFPGRPKSFLTRLNAIDRGTGEILKSQTIRVNDPFEFRNFVFYQASYGQLGDYKLALRIINKKKPREDQSFQRVKMGEIFEVKHLEAKVIPVRAMMDVQGLGPGVQVQQVGDNDQLLGEPFWLLKNHPEYDFRDDNRSWGVVLDEVEEQYFTGLQVGHDPGAPIYWFGCFGMILGTFYALFWQHKKYHLIWTKDGKITFTASIHRLPVQFEKELVSESKRLEKMSAG